jgi:hypothetical protein
MGSTGTGKFGNYPSSRKQSNLNGQNSVSSDSTDISFDNNTEEESILCMKPLLKVNLEDVAQNDYFIKYHNVPPIDHSVNISSQLKNGRIVVVSKENLVIIGNLPTEYNYISACLSSGYKYEGTVVSSGTSPFPYVVVDLYARY